MLRKFESENKNQNKKKLRLKIYEKVRNGRLKLEPSVLIKRTTCTRISTHVVRTNNHGVEKISFSFVVRFQNTNENDFHGFGYSVI